MFKNLLQEIADRTEGCLGVLIIGMDGIIVEKIFGEESEFKNFDIAVAEFTALFRKAKQSSETSGLDSLSELTISGREKNFILRLLGEEYFLIMILSADGNFGRGRFELRRAELLLEEEFVL